MMLLRAFLTWLKCSYTSWLLLALMLSQKYQTCSSTATLKVTFETYVNPSGRDMANRPCDLVFYTACDSIFDFCVDKPSSQKEVTSCEYFYQSTGEFRNQDSIVFGSSMAGVANPIIVNINKWENVDLRVRVRDHDSTSGYDDVDKHHYRYIATPGVNNSYTAPLSRQIVGRRSSQSTTLLVKFSVKCNMHYYSSDCTKYCRPTNNRNGHYRCIDNGNKQCLPGWEDPGGDCTIRSDDCIGHTCVNGATCVDGVRSYTCKCTRGFTGERCETEIDECESSPCMNNGSCTDLVGGFTCDCPTEYPSILSPTCEEHVCTQNDPCQNGATCYGNGRCLCPPNYTGLRCEMTYCEQNCVVCHNGGTCTGSACACPPGIYGQQCEVDICDHITCFNGGNCTNGTCICPEDYTGLYCQDLVDNCASSPCLNGGFCINKRKEYTCFCKNDYIGARCDTEKPRPTTEKPEKDVKDKGPNVNGNKERQNGEPAAAGIIQGASPSTLFLAMIICLVFMLLIIIVLVLILCKGRINRKRKQMMADRDREGTMTNFDNPVYTVDRTGQRQRANVYDDARYMQPVDENDINSVRYAEAMPTGGGATGVKGNPESAYDYPKGDRDLISSVMDPVYDQPRNQPRPLTELQEPPPYSPLPDTHYANGGAAISMNALKARLDDEPQYEDIQSMKKAPH